MKKVVYVVPILAPYAIQRFEEMAKNKNIELHVIVETNTLASRTGWCYKEIPGCKTYLLRGLGYKYESNHSKSGYTIISSRRITFGLRKLVNKISPDIVIVCNSMQIASLFLFRKYKLGVVVEDTLRAAEGRKKLNKKIKRFLLYQVDFYLPFTTDATKFLKKNGITKNIYPSSWSINPDFFRDLSNGQKRLETKSKLGMLPDKVNYVIVGALIPRKGIGPFICAWKKMPQEFLRASDLFILGDGPLEKELQNISNGVKGIHFCGNQDYPTVSHYLQCADVFVLPTLEDLCSLAVFEAMAAGCPVMTTQYNGAKDLVHDSVNGYIFDIENEVSTIDALKKMAQSDRNAMSEESSRMIEKYSNKNVMSELVKQLLSLV